MKDVVQYNYLIQYSQSHHRLFVHELSVLLSHLLTLLSIAIELDLNICQIVNQTVTEKRGT